VLAQPGVVTLFNNTTKTPTQLSIPNATAAAFSPDGLKAFIVSGSVLYVSSPVIPLATINLSGTANDVTVLPQGPAFYLAGGDSSAITQRATCTNLLQGTLTTATSPTFIRSNLDSTHVFAVDAANLFDVSVSVTSPACPPSLTNSLATFNFGAGTFVPGQLIGAGDGVHVFVTSDQPSVLTYNATTNLAGSVALSGGATSATTGGTTLDSAQLYVGAAGTNDVHRIDVGTGLDVQAISVGLKKPDGSAQAPDLVAVRPR